MKRAVIVHCWEGYPVLCWYPQTKKELESLGFEVSIPSMPNTNKPQLQEWLATLTKLVGEPDADLFLIGHSLGCITILRYLETLKEHEKVGGVILVAGFTDDLGFEELKNFYATPLDFEKIKSRANQFVIIASDNDQYVPLKYADLLEEKLQATKIIKHNMNHFSGDIDQPDSITSLPEVAEEIKKIIRG